MREIKMDLQEKILWALAAFGCFVYIFWRIKKRFGFSDNILKHSHELIRLKAVRTHMTEFMVFVMALQEAYPTKGSVSDEELANRNRLIEQAWQEYKKDPEHFDSRNYPWLHAFLIRGDRLDET